MQPKPTAFLVATQPPSRLAVRSMILLLLIAISGKQAGFAAAVGGLREGTDRKHQQQQQRHRNVQSFAGGNNNSNDSKHCHVCETNPTLLLPDQMPLSWMYAMSRPLPNFLRVDNDLDGAGIPKDVRDAMSCGDWESFASPEENEWGAFFGADTTQCHDLVDYLELQCCNMTARNSTWPPVYECETAAKHALLDSETSVYDPEIAPFLGDGGDLIIGAQVEIYNGTLLNSKIVT